jgi:hypothetical protein
MPGELLEPPNGGDDLTVNGGDYAFYGPPLTTLCSTAVQLVGVDAGCRIMPSPRGRRGGKGVKV